MREIADQSTDGDRLPRCGYRRPKYGYESRRLPMAASRPAVEELIRWRLWNRTGGGLMAELGSHQLDAASIFISAQHGDGKNVHPLSVSRRSAAGTSSRPIAIARTTSTASFEFPGKGYYKDEAIDRGGRPEQEDRRHLFVDQRQRLRRLRRNRVRHQGHADPGAGTGRDALQRLGHGDAHRSEARKGGKAAMDTYETGGGAARGPGGSRQQGHPAAATAKKSSTGRGAFKQSRRSNKPHCTPEVALGDAVIALTSNLAIAARQADRIRPEVVRPERRRHARRRTRRARRPISR